MVNLKERTKAFDLLANNLTETGFQMILLKWKLTDKIPWKVRRF